MRCRKCCLSQFNASEEIQVHLIKHRASAICYHHAEPLKCLRITCNSSLKAFWPIARLIVKSNEQSNEVAQFNAKFRLALNWTLLRLFDFIIICTDRSGSYKCVVNMLVIKNPA